MINAVFQGHLAFLALGIAVTLACGAAVYGLSLRSIDRVRAVFYGLWTSSTVGPIILTTWDGSGILTHRCTVNPAAFEAFGTTQGQLNFALFAPFGLFAALATRRPAFSAALGVVSTAVVETAQATVPFISRLCDTDDLATNTGGVLAGAAIGALVCRRTHYGTPLARAAVKRTAIAGVAISSLVAATWVSTIEPVRAMPPAPDPAATPEQVRALNAELKRAFGDAYTVEKAGIMNNADGPKTVSAPLPGGFAELTWPDREKITVHFTPTGRGEGTHAYWVPDASRPLTTAAEAQQVATLFAQRYAPWALRDSKVTASPVDASEKNLGWLVEWRRWHGNLLMPMRLSILLEPSGRMTDLIARHVDDPKVPRGLVTEHYTAGLHHSPQHRQS